MPRLCPASGARPQAANRILPDTDLNATNETVGILIEGLSIPKQHPLVGRTVEQGYRELVISRGRTGYVALYTYDTTRNVALVLAIRHQRESGLID